MFHLELYQCQLYVWICIFLFRFASSEMISTYEEVEADPIDLYMYLY